MVTFLARLRMMTGKESEAMAAFKEMVAAVRQNEPGALAYCCHQNPADSLEVVFYEAYVDEAAKDAHMKTPHFGKLMGLMGDVLDKAAGGVIEDLRPVSGFCRETSA